MKNYFGDDVPKEVHFDEVPVMMSSEKFDDEVISHPSSALEMTGEKQQT